MYYITIYLPKHVVARQSVTSTTDNLTFIYIYIYIYIYVIISSRGGTKVLWVHSAHARNNKTAVLLRFIVSDIDRIIYIHNVLEIQCSEHMKYNH